METGEVQDILGKVAELHNRVDVLTNAVNAIGGAAMDADKVNLIDVIYMTDDIRTSVGRLLKGMVGQSFLVFADLYYKADEEKTYLRLQRRYLKAMSDGSLQFYGDEKEIPPLLVDVMGGVATWRDPT